MKCWLFATVVCVVAACGAHAEIGFADSAPGPLDTERPVFMDLNAAPDRAMAGDVVTLSFTASKMLDGDPSVLVNGALVSILSEKSGLTYNALFLVTDSEPIGPARIQIFGQDALGNEGDLDDSTILEILEATPEMPLRLWPWAILLLAAMAGLAAAARRRPRSVSALFLACLPGLAATAGAQAPVVYDVGFVQQPAPGGGTQVIVSYSLDAHNPCAVYLALSQDLDDDDFVSPVTRYEGHIANITTGESYQIAWDIARDYPNASFPEARIRVIADDDPTPHALSYTAGENGAVLGPVAQAVDHGADGAPVTAQPDEHYIFLEWSDGVTTATRQDTVITSDIHVTAVFAPLGYGSVFLEGESMRIPTVHRSPGAWQILDDALEIVASGSFADGDPYIEAGKLPTGWYRIEFPDEGDVFTTAAVLAPLKATPSPDTPVAVDIALSWATGADHPGDPAGWRHAARAAALAGVRTVRDRIRWRHFQPSEGPLVEGPLKYEHVAAVQREFGLQIVQVFHDAPAWTRDHIEDAGRMPPDLRHTWEFCRAVAERMKDTVHIWQPWNEGNSPNFGRHTIDELCSHQKAAYWGFKTGNPDAVVTWAPLGGINSDGLCRGIQENGTLPYFDVYALHSYEWPDAYERVREDALETAAGKPLWVTESDRGIPLDPASPHQDLSYENERRKAQFMAQSIASSLASGAKRNFHFLLRQYGTQHQFGLLRHDDTPRMTYVALAAAGRLLADAEYLGRVQHEHGVDVHVLAFRARPDGIDRDVLVVWTELRVEWEQRGQAVSPLDLPSGLVISSVWDYLGRPLDAHIPTEATSAPIFVVMPVGQVDKLTLETPAPAPDTPDEPPSPVVLQLRVPVGTRQLVYRLHNWAPEHDRAMDAGTHELIVSAYHFGEDSVSGTISVDALPDGWTCVPDSWSVTDLESMERFDQTVMLTIPPPGPPAEDGAWTRFQGDFGEAGMPRLAFRAMPK